MTQAWRSTRLCPSATLARRFCVAWVGRRERASGVAGRTPTTSLSRMSTVVLTDLGLARTQRQVLAQAVAERKEAVRHVHSVLRILLLQYNERAFVRTLRLRHGCHRFTQPLGVSVTDRC